VRNLVALGPRHPGSVARQRAADYICARIQALGLAPIREAWHDEAEGLTFENLRVVLPGRSPKTLLLGTHYDTKLELAVPPAPGEGPFVGANDGGSGSGLLLALCEDLVLRGLERPALELVWLDGEESIPPRWDAARALFGAREFVRRHLGRDHRYGAFVLLDMVGHRELAIDRETSSTEALFAPFENAARALGHAAHFFGTTTAVDDDHMPFLNAGVPAVDLIQFEHNPEWHTYRDTLAIVSARSLAIVGSVILAALPELEASLR
jgi:Zn-dependent M28 family amino/carboxypeptidase